MPAEITRLTDAAYRDQLIDTLVGRCLPAVAFDAVPIPIEGGGSCLVVEVAASTPSGCRRANAKPASAMPRMEARAEVVNRLIDEANPTRMIGAGIGDTPPWFTLLLVPMFGPVDIFNPAEFTVPALHTVVPKARTEMPGRFLNARPTRQGLE